MFRRKDRGVFRETPPPPNPAANLVGTNPNTRLHGFMLCFFCLLSLGFFFRLEAADPPGLTWSDGIKPGDVFREYVYAPPSAWTIKPETDVEITIDDLKEAVKAELSPEYWGGHIGTSMQRVVFNGKMDQPVYYPLPKNTPHAPECYHRHMYGNTATKIPLSLLKEGKNTFQFFQDEQICHGFDWPNTLTYGVVVRVYYNPATKPHPTGTITSPIAGTDVGFKHRFKIKVTENGSPIKRVDYIGHYEDFDWQGNGLYTDWHYYHMKGMWIPGVGRSDRPPYSTTWSNYFVPDQPGPIKFMARIMAKDNMCYMTPAVENVTLKRPYAVKMFKPSMVPQRFAVRIGGRSNCRIEFGGSDPTKADEIIMHLSTWGAKSPPGAYIYLDNVEFKHNWGVFHAPHMAKWTVDKKFFTSGKTYMRFEIYSETKDHACEINWPGPVMMARYGDYPGIRQTAPPTPAGFGASCQLRETRLQYQIMENGPFSIEFLNPHGRVVSGHAGDGPQLGVLDLSRYPAGVYLARILTESQATVKKIVIVK